MNEQVTITWSQVQIGGGWVTISQQKSLITFIIKFALACTVVDNILLLDGLSCGIEYLAKAFQSLKIPFSTYCDSEKYEECISLLWGEMEHPCFFYSSNGILIFCWMTLFSSLIKESTGSSIT